MEIAHEIGYVVFLMLKSRVHFALRAHYNPDIKFSLEILDRYFDFIKLMAEKVNLHAQVVPSILKCPWGLVSP